MAGICAFEAASERRRDALSRRRGNR